MSQRRPQLAGTGLGTHVRAPGYASAERDNSSGKQDVKRGGEGQRRLSHRLAGPTFIPDVSVHVRAALGPKPWENASPVVREIIFFRKYQYGATTMFENPPGPTFLHTRARPDPG